MEALATPTLDRAWIEEKSARVLANCHPKQRAFVEDLSRRVSALVGRRGGKTTGMRARFVLRMVRTPRARCVFVAMTRRSAEDLMWGPLKDLLGRLGIEATFNETKLRCTLTRNGSQLTLVGADDKREIDKLRGLKFHEVGIDEAASFPASLLESLIDRVIAPALGDYRGVLCMFGTPGHVLQGPFYDATRPGSERHRPFAKREADDEWRGWSSHTWTLRDGAPFVPAMANAWREALVEKEEKGWSDDNPIWLREWCGQWAADNADMVFKFRPHLDDGSPWNTWDPPRIGPFKLAELPPNDRNDWEHVIGMDLGHADPFALSVWAFSPTDPDRNLWHRYEFVQPKMYARTIADKLIGAERNHMKPSGLIGALDGWPVAMVADLAALGDTLLDELREVYGIGIAAAEKGYKYKYPAIELFNGDLIDGHIHVLAGSQLETELMTLQWREDEFGSYKENKAQANHCSDSAIYARVVIAKLFESGSIALRPVELRRTAEDEPEEPTERVVEAEDGIDYDLLLDPGLLDDSGTGAW